MPNPFTSATSAESIMTQDQQATADLEIQPTEVQQRLDAGEELLLLDCRTPEEWSTCHLQNAHLIPLQEMSLRLHELDPWKGKPIVVYCHKGARSLIITRLLRHLDFESVHSMLGGIDAWANEVDKDMPTY